jgi:hypothetical protein
MALPLFVWHAFGTESIFVRREISHIEAPHSSSLREQGCRQIEENDDTADRRLPC